MQWGGQHAPASECGKGHDEEWSSNVQSSILDDFVSPVSECKLHIAEDLDYFDEDEEGYLSEDSLDPDNMTYEVCGMHEAQMSTDMHLGPSPAPYWGRPSCLFLCPRLRDLSTTSRPWQGCAQWCCHHCMC